MKSGSLAFLVLTLGTLLRPLAAITAESSPTTTGSPAPLAAVEAPREAIAPQTTNTATTTNSVPAGQVPSTNAPATTPATPVTNAAPTVLTPEAALAAFRLEKGFRIELAAAEPLVQSPVAAAFDEFGRLYVVEMRDYPAQRAARLGRVRLLEDTDEDGKFDKATVFADSLPWPSAIACANGGVFVGATPDLWFFKDNDRDGVADEKRVVLTGFAADYAPYDAIKLDVQALMNSFTWGLDNRIHGVTSFNGGRLAVAGGGLVDLHGRDFQFDPRSLVLDAEAGGAQNGLSFDSSGHKFVSSLRDPLQAIVYDDRYAVRNPYFAMPPARVSIAADGLAPPIFRLTPGAAYLGAASGLVIYRGNAFPEEYAEDAFVGDLAANLVHRKKIFWPNIVPVARRAPTGERGEFLASSDPLFRPVQLLNGPDGALYVLDLHRGVIAHPWSLDESLSRQLDLNLGREQGRIYRIVPPGFQHPPLDKLGYATIPDLVTALEHRNGWHRETAARLLLERQDNRAAPLVAKLLLESKSPVGRLQALFTLDGLGALGLPHVFRGLADADGRVREQALRLSEKFIPANAPLPAELATAFNALTGDSAARVRFQLAFTLGQLAPAARLEPLAVLIRRDLGNPWMHAAVLGSLAEGADQMLLRIAVVPAMSGTVPGQEFLMQLATMVGARNQAPEVQRVFNATLGLPDDAPKFALLRALNDGLERSGATWRSLEQGTSLFALRTLLKNIPGAPGSTDAQRLQVIPLIATEEYAEAVSVLLPLLGGRQAPGLQLEVIRALDRFSGTQVAADLVDRWRILTPALRVEVVEMLLARPERAAVLMSALERSFIQPTELNVVQLQRLSEYPDPTIRRRAAASIGRLWNSNRNQVLAAFSSALKTRGNAVRGQAIFRERCAGCHRLAGGGGDYGPELSGVRGNGRQWLLTNILEPNHYLAGAYAAHRVTLRTGQILEGLLASENPASILLRRPGTADKLLLRQDIQSIDNLGVSLMPEGLEWGLTPLNVSDLLDYLLSVP